MLASRRASKVLGGPFKEAIPEQDGRFHWRIEPIFNAWAFEIVMRIIHGQTRDVSRCMTVKELAYIAVIVDDLECHNVVWFFAKSWVEQVKREVPTYICEDLVRWILISFVFDEPEIFRSATRTAIRYSEDVMPTFDLPIRPEILGRLQSPRYRHNANGIRGNRYKKRSCFHVFDQPSGSAGAETFPGSIGVQSSLQNHVAWHTQSSNEVKLTVRASTLPVICLVKHHHSH